MKAGNHEPTRKQVQALNSLLCQVEALRERNIRLAVIGYLVRRPIHSTYGLRSGEIRELIDEIKEQGAWKVKKEWQDAFRIIADKVSAKGTHTV